MRDFSGKSHETYFKPTSIAEHPATIFLDQAMAILTNNKFDSKLLVVHD